jgi:hypothetical protein
MELADNVKHSAALVEADSASPSNPLAHCPQPTGGQLGEPCTSRIVPIKPEYGDPAVRLSSFNKPLSSPQVIVDEIGRLLRA